LFPLLSLLSFYDRRAHATSNCALITFIHQFFVLHVLIKKVFDIDDKIFFIDRFEQVDGRALFLAAHDDVLVRDGGQEDDRDFRECGVGYWLLCLLNLSLCRKLYN
jgi:hypothetical protein